MRILVADDMGAMRQTVKKTLNTLGFDQIAEAKNGKEAYDVIHAGLDTPGRRIDLAIIDWNMAPISGLELLKMLRADEKTRDILFVMLTAEQMRDNILLALQSKVDEYIIKPFTADTIREKFDKITLRELGRVRKDVGERLAAAAESIEPVPDAGKEKALKDFVKHLGKIAEISPWSYYAPMETAKTFMRFGRLGEAEKWARRVISINFGVAEAHKLLSQVLRGQGKIPESVEELRIASVERPRSGEIRQKLGEAYLREGKLDEAISALSESIALLGDEKLLARSKSGLGDAKLKKGEKEGNEALQSEAVGELEEASRLDPDLVSASYNLMVAYKKAGRAKEALDVLKSIRKMEPKDAEGWIALGKAYMGENEKSKALFAFRKAGEMAGDSFPVCEQIATALYHAGAYDEALAFIEKARAINPSDVFSYNLAGIIHRIREEHTAAVKEYHKASQLDPDNPGIYFNLGVAYYKIGDETKSAENFKKAASLDPGLPELGSYMEKLGMA